MTEYYWIFNEDGSLIGLQKIHKITKEISLAIVKENNKLDEFFRTKAGDLTGMVSEIYLKQYKNYVKKSQEA